MAGKKAKRTAKPRTTVKKAPAKKTDAATTVYTCTTCGKTTMTRAHLCNPRKTSSTVYVCEFCGVTSGDPYHVCSPMVAEVKYTCADCGRLSPFRGALCRPKPIG